MGWRAWVLMPLAVLGSVTVGGAKHHRGSAVSAAWGLRGAAVVHKDSQVPVATVPPTITPVEMARLKQNMAQWNEHLSDMASEVVVGAVRDFVSTVARQKAHEEAEKIFYRLYPQMTTAPPAAVAVAAGPAPAPAPVL
mmetsp:Transcript_49095/g.106899  ORF Transcript_49095/g.106899 Transcript_49095/m.106899 type:complete len:138 (+) Transcript_49095:79-492(+)|eukprot:CAMPEP_0204270936 /NCGR_PEP_ID=MMETSP0468-20130131/19176_1 /ASSEMBLY_ACC=CAM_ASM_000383 /TAXON_ID=2969 /ORGANISM="Oxyrrhis marina" /LENGTH=137 /DNA_ID=CAMNT_0051246531 /DNA_START=79 /DNA_END=492 /DNA_ORIENTATION=+